MSFHIFQTILLLWHQLHAWTTCFFLLSLYEQSTDQNGTKSDGLIWIISSFTTDFVRTFQLSSLSFLDGRNRLLCGTLCSLCSPLTQKIAFLLLAHIWIILVIIIFILAAIWEKNRLIFSGELFLRKRFNLSTSVSLLFTNYPVRDNLFLFLCNSLLTLRKRTAPILDIRAKVEGCSICTFFFSAPDFLAELSPLSWKLTLVLSTTILYWSPEWEKILHIQRC